MFNVSVVGLRGTFSHGNVHGACGSFHSHEEDSLFSLLVQTHMHMNGVSLIYSVVLMTRTCFFLSCGTAGVPNGAFIGQDTLYCVSIKVP